MSHTKRKFLLIFCLTFLLLNGVINPCSAAIEDHSSIGITQGSVYQWTLSDVDEDVVKDLMGSFPLLFVIRDGKQIKISIEKVIANDEGYDIDNWTVHYDCCNIFYETDDDGEDGIYQIYKDPTLYAPLLTGFFSIGAGHPFYLTTGNYFRILFIPTDVEEFLDEADDLSSSLNADGNTIEYNGTGIKAAFEYDSNGILSKLKIEYNDEVCYVLSGGAGAISYGIYFIPVGITAIIGIIVYMKRHKKIGKI